MEVNLDRSGSAALYRQIADEIRESIKSGETPLGSALPPVRAMATKLGVAHLTMVRAYDELSRTGWVVTENRQATRVVEVLPIEHAVSSLGRLPNAGPVSDFESVGRSARIRSLASSVPDPRLFNGDELVAEIEAMRRESGWTFYHSEAAGNPELLSAISGLLGAEGVPFGASDLLVTFGGTHALSLVLDAVAPRGSTVLVQEPGPLFLRELLKTKNLTGIPVQLAGSGLDLDDLASSIKSHRPKAMLICPDFGHSTGLRMPIDQRISIVELAQEHQIHLIEDRSLAPIRFDDERTPSIAEISAGTSSLIGSFSYTLSPGLRLGFLASPPATRRNALARFKAEHISGVGFLQLAVARTIERGSYAAHLRRVIPKYRARRDALIRTLTQWMPANVTWTAPEGGLSTWLTLEHAKGTDELYRRALKRGVAFAPGSLFVTASDPKRHARLSFGLLEPDQIVEAVQILSGIIGHSSF